MSWIERHLSGLSALNVVIKNFRPSARVGDLYSSDDLTELSKLERMGFVLRLETDTVLEHLGVPDVGALEEASEALKLEVEGLKTKLENGATGYDALNAAYEQLKAQVLDLGQQNMSLKIQLEIPELLVEPVPEPTVVETLPEDSPPAGPAELADLAPDAPKKAPKGK